MSDVRRDVSVVEAAKRMRQDHVGDLVVVEERDGRLAVLDAALDAILVRLHAASRRT